MTLYQNQYRIESARLKNWDYSTPGFYFFTCCTKNRIHLFGEISNNRMSVNAAGKIVWDCWFDLTNHYPDLVLDEFIVMPDHIHGIIQIIDNERNGHVPQIDVINNENDVAVVVETGLRPVSTTTTANPTANPTADTMHHGHKKKYGLSEFVRALKSFSARRINEMQKTTGLQIWQSRFYDHIIRNPAALNRIRKYIQDNPAHWQRNHLYRLK